jgi:hypothetical protein
MTQLQASCAGHQPEKTKRQEDNTDGTEELDDRIRTRHYMPMAAEVGLLDITEQRYANSFRNMLQEMPRAR